MSTFRQIDVLGALEAAGIQYQRSGSWVRIRAIWRESRAKDVAVHIDNGGWRDHGGMGEHGAWPSLCERLGIHCPTQTWTHEERAEYGRQMAAKWAARAKSEAEDASRRMRAAMSLWERRSVDLDHHTDRHAAAMSDYIRYRGLRRETLMQVARVGQSNGLPCLVYGRRDPRTGKITTVHREWDKRTWPADAGTNKRGLGPQFWSGQTAYIEYNRWTGAAVAPGAMAAIAEGQLSAACGAELYPDSPVLSVFTMGGLERPPVTRIRELVEAGGFTILILGDRGGMKAAQECARQILLACPGAKIRIAIPPEGRVEGQKKGEDWLDVRVGYAGVVGIGDDATRVLIEQVAVAHGIGPRLVEDSENNILSLTPWQQTERAASQDWPALSDVEQQIQRAIGHALDSTEPAIVVAQPGTGKTHVAIDHIRMGTKPVLWLSPTLDDAAGVAAQVPGAHLHRGRNADNCRQYHTIDALTNRGRAPYPWACATCHHGQVDSEDPCEYMQALRGSVYKKVVVGAHGAGAEDSLLYQYCSDPNADAEERELIVDESPTITAVARIAPEDLSQWRVGAADAGSRLVDPPTPASDADNETRKRHQAACRAIERARGWVAEITPELDRLALTLAGAPADHGLHKLTGFERFAELAANIPPGARLLDATVIEAVRGGHGGDLVVPLRGIANLGSAIQAGTAWIQDGAIIATNSGTLWTQILKRGGTLLDATPSLRQREEVLAAGGSVHTIRAAEPMLRLTQFGPRLHGRGGLTPQRLSKEAEAARDVAGTDPVITHRPIAAALNKEAGDGPRQFGHWGRDHRAHNRWKEADRLVLWGLPLLSPNEQRIQYLSDRAALAAQGIDWPDWDGSASAGQVVPTDGWRIRSAARLPIEPQARAWLLDRLAADVAQGVGRLRAVRRAKPVTVEIYGLLPLVGHGIHIDEIQMESQGRLANKTRARAVLARGVVDLGEARTRAKLVEYFRRQTGVRISNGDCDRLVAELKVQALASGITLYEAARQSCAANTRLLAAGHEPQAIAQAARAMGGLPGVVAVASLLDQCRRAPGAQRAGP